MNQFEALGLVSPLLKTVTELGFEDPTPIQIKAIPDALSGRDILGLAQTGTGKTAAFGLPLVQQLSRGEHKRDKRSTNALILAPTRELANQITVNLRAYARRAHLRIETVVGGASLHVQMRRLERGTDILVATPGRLLDLIDRKAIFLNKARFLILDEADQMLDLGFIHALRKIAPLVGTPRQTMLFSATMPKQIEELAQTYLQDPVRVEVSPAGRAADKVRQCVHFLNQSEKAAYLKSLLAERDGDLSLVFARTKHGAEKLMKTLVAAGFNAASIHGNKSQSQRDKAIKGFRSGDIRILVATDVAARGIDIPGVSHVYNYDLPDTPENYVHRIGRTARAGADGEAIAFCSSVEVKQLRDIQKLMGLTIEVASGTEPKAESRTRGNGKRPSGKGAPRPGKPRKPRHKSAKPGAPRSKSGAPRKRFKARKRSAA